MRTSPLVTYDPSLWVLSVPSMPTTRDTASRSMTLKTRSPASFKNTTYSPLIRTTSPPVLSRTTVEYCSSSSPSMMILNSPPHTSAPLTPLIIRRLLASLANWVWMNKSTSKKSLLPPATPCSLSPPLPPGSSTPFRLAARGPTRTYVPRPSPLTTGGSSLTSINIMRMTRNLPASTTSVNNLCSNAMASARPRLLLLQDLNLPTRPSAYPTLARSTQTQPHPCTPPTV